MWRSRFLFASIFVCLVAAGAASAQTAYTTKDANLRAGPSRDYPLVARLPYGTGVQVAGCLNDWSWCDVILPQDRGWIYAGNLDYPYENGQIPIVTGGVYLNLPIVTFSVGPYWDNYYRQRPWYGQRGVWLSRPPASHWRGIAGQHQAPRVVPTDRRPTNWHPPGWHAEASNPGNARVRPMQPREAHPNGNHGRSARPAPQQKRPPNPPKHDHGKGNGH
ncbi:MAG: SH3 domain-containing protein [Thermoanaerobaculia bacterium]